MIRKIAKNDQFDFLDWAKKFYSSATIISKVDENVLQKTFNEMICSNQYLAGLVFEYEGNDCGYAIISKMFSTEVIESN